MAEEIHCDRRNYRKHNDKNKKLIKKSLEDCGAGRSILLDNEGEIIAGNGVYEQAQKLGMKVKVVESDGSEIVAVKRTDLCTADEKRVKLAVLDNSTSDSSEFDIELLKMDFDDDELSDLGIDDIGDLIGDGAGDGGDGGDGEGGELRFGKYYVALSLDELNRLSEVADTYFNKEGTLNGFGWYLAEGKNP